MFTVVFHTKRVPGLSREQFFAHYRSHYDLAIALPGLRAYRQMEIGHGDAAWAEPESFSGYDAVSTYSFDSRADADRAFASPEGIALNEDTGLFIDWDSVLSTPVEHIRTFGGAS